MIGNVLGIVASLVVTVSARLGGGGNTMAMAVPFEPKTYVSPSGHYSLWVNPSKPFGSKTASYKFSKNGKPLWSKSLAFTLTEAAVDDAGMIGGYADGSTSGDWSFFRVILMNSDGRLVLDQKRFRTEAERQSLTEPYCKGVMMQDSPVRMILRIGSRDLGRNEDWWTYDLSTLRAGEILHPMRDVSSPSGPVSGARPIPGTSLFLVDSFLGDYAGTEGAAFAVVDAVGKIIWHLEKPGDYDSSGSGRASEARTYAVRKLGSVLGVKPGGRFDLWFVKAGQRVTFKAESQAGGWHVAEVGRSKYLTGPPQRKGLAAKYVKLKLARRWNIPLGPAHLNPIHDVDCFEFLGADRVAVLRGGVNPALVVTTRAGRISREIPIPVGDTEPTRNRCLARVGGTKVMVIGAKSRNSKADTAWKIDTVTSAVSVIAGFDRNSAAAAVGFPDGRFAVIDTTVKMFTPDGKLSWEYAEKEPNGTSVLMDPVDLAADVHGRLLVLDRHAGVVFLDGNGKHLKELDISAHGLQHGYPTGLAVKSEHSVLVAGMDTFEGVGELDTKGDVSKLIALSFRNGKRPSYLREVRVDPNGETWFTNGYGIYEINEHGLVVRTLGPVYKSGGLTSVRDAVVDPSGRVYAMDEPTAEVYYFDRAGRHVFTGKPAAGDYRSNPPNPGGPYITRSGDVYVGLYEPIRFSPTGVRLGKVKVGEATTIQEIPTPKKTWRWNAEKLLDESGNVKGILNRWPDQCWMLHGPTAVAPDGSVLLVGNQGEGYYSHDPERIAFYSATGKPQGQFELPGQVGEIDSVAYDGKLAYLVRGAEVVAFNRQGKAAWRFKLPHNPGFYWKVFPSRGGIAVWNGSHTVLWYKLP